MRFIWLTLSTCLSTAAVLAAGSTYADEALNKAVANPANFAMPRLNDAATAYSTLKQINTGNVGKLQVAWTFSTGVLRGHEGAPLVIGDVMYVHAPFPNTVFALRHHHLEVRAEAGSERHPGDVLRHRQSRLVLW
jgi:lanthanide-dependent methanol dehydrogenase